MTCNIFTILSSYFRCCCKNKNDEKKYDDYDRYQVNSRENSPFTFEDVSAITDSGTSNDWSSSSTLDEYNNKPTLNVKDSFLQRKKKYQRRLFFLYKENYENHDHDDDDDRPSP